MSEPASGFDAETRARIDCAEQFDETGTHLSDCPRAHPQEGGATGMSESTLAGQFCAHLHVEWHTRDDGNLTVGWWECAVCPQHFVPFTEDLIRTVAALTAENERLKSALERIAAPGFPSASDAMLQSKIARAALPHPCTCHPDDNPPKPCARRYAYSECVKAAADELARLRAREIL